MPKLAPISLEEREVLYEKARLLYHDHMAAATKCLYVAAQILAEAESHQNKEVAPEIDCRTGEIVRFLREWSDMADFYPDIPRTIAWWLANRDRIKNDREDMIG